MKLQEGQVAVVTGAGSGIGLALASAFAGRRLSVVLADRDAASLAAAENSIRRSGGTVLSVLTDVTKAPEVSRLVSATRERFGRCDVLCNNAGVAPPPALLWEHTDAAWRWTMEVGLFGAINVLRAFLPGFIERGTGHVVTISSLAGLAPLPLVAPYCATKYALVGLTECLADELAKLAPGIGVSLVCPGMVESGLSVTSARDAPQGLYANAAPPPAELAKILIERCGDVLSPPEVAATVLEGIEADRLHIFTHGNLHRRIREEIFGTSI